ncbi:uncharacterized protein CFAP92 isoform X3 [Rhineura floridana]|nr:uncharacterized protein CFAP92 isoform X3 [Rhineura floridana]XP_061474117.1 uncharacterized protein CFAP92 isoform X3 [Rhineura floridana]XP_061474118.1 uncharacterized protein CFAP92 isoform X3 [Rhineura floridana]XP_061474119.1 uncharacterized protein CFAP92 isoform X3 [Rhineura floridana]XP_061474120.1 uncharacterized protein CFAP92 isoform X3 [Rhineura floridana]
MASKLPDLEEQDDDEDEEAAESKETDINTLRSDSTYGSETPEACGGGHPTPEDESTTRSYSLRSQEFDTQHLVNCTFSVSLALPVVAPTNRPWTSSRQDIPGTAYKMKEGFIPKMHRFYHMEYFLLPDDIEPRKLDLVLFGPLAKLYLEAESKSETPKDSERPKSKKSSTLHISVVKPWIENDQVWVSWNHSIEINVTSDFLMKLRDHNIKLRLWDLKEKVCAKARFSKQKSNPPSSDQAAFDGSVKRMVLFQRNFLERNQPKPSYTKTKPSEVPGIPEKSATGTTAVAPSSAVSKHLEEDPDSAIEQKTYCKSSSPQRGPKSEELSQSLSAISISGSIPSSLREKTIQEAKIIKQKLHKKVSAKSTVAVFGKTNLGKLMEHSDRKDSVGGVLLQLSERKKLLQKSVFLGKKSGATLKPTAKEIAALTAQAKKFGIAFLQLDLMPLLSGERYVASRLREKSPKIYDAYLSFSVEKPLMTEKQKRELNPLIIKIKSARCLPDTPIPIEELQSSCVPVYCKYKFQNMQPRQTQGRDHGTDVFFEDINVILAGTIKHGELNEYLRGPPLEIEVHDRDKKMEGVKIKPSLFGEEPGDHKLSNVSMVTSRYMVQNPITSREEMWHPYGVAKISLAELLLGEKVLNFSAPIHSCSVQDTSVCQGASTAQKAKGVSQCQVVQMPMGHYVCSESYLKVRVEITIPLSPEDETDDTETDYCPYGCIIYIFDYKNTSLISYLLQEITKINAEALQLDSYPLHIIQNSLNTLKLNHKLTFEEISQMDVLTGFHILDGSIHLLILEGLKNKALKRIWNKRIDRLHETKTGRLQIFYNSHLSFHQRLYVDFEAILFHIRLCKPLSSIMKQPLFYVRDIVPQPCFEALTRLDYICRSMKLREVIHHSLLPSAEMVTMLSQEFGVPLNKDDLLIQQYSEISEMFEMPTKYLHMKQDKRSLLDNHNEEYILRKKEMERHTPQDYIQSNIDNITLLSKMVKKEGTRTIRAFPSDGKSIFNYSCQTLNSAEIAKKLLRQEMAEEPDKRFAYNQEYLSGIFDPVVEDSALKESIDQSKSMWLSPEGFVYPGFKSSIESNLHPHMPDEARLMELHEKWQENLLNASNMKPVLDRDRWSWDKRNVDFELYKKPPCAFVPLDTHRVEPLTDTRCNTALKVHRCCPATELISSGPKASSQLARLQGLLKDKPIKLSFKMQPTPILGTLDNVEESSICQGFVPGSETHHSLKWNGNIIPCYDRKHNVFKTLKGADFRLICHKHSFRYKRWPPQRLRLMDKILTKDRQDGVTFAPELNN